MLAEIKLYNTLSRKKEIFVSRQEGRVNMYCCGPTVYNYIHLGNARPFIIFDLLRRVLEKSGYEVNYIQNFTDIDDKVIKKAWSEKVPFSDIAKRYINEYFHDADALNIKRASLHPLATESIPTILEMINLLLAKEHAYIIEDGIYFSTESFPNYGKLARLNKDELQDAGRVEQNSSKKSPHDFAIWKFKKDNEPAWDSPWGEGRPGWHIECSAMIKEHFDNEIDIHCGGKDLIFPHHENEIAQSECSCGKHFANYWLHNGFVDVNNEKMSKSLNNFFTVRDIAKKYPYEIIRYFILTAQYRNPINFSDDLLEASQNKLKRLEIALDDAQKITTACAKTFNILLDKNEIDKLKETYMQAFYLALRDDLNTPQALASLAIHTNELNKSTANYRNILQLNELEEADALNFSKYFAQLQAFEEMLEVLGIVFKKEAEIPEEILLLVESRKLAKMNKNYQLADEIRNQIKDKGYVLKDTPEGTEVHRSA